MKRTRNWIIGIIITLSALGSYGFISYLYPKLTLFHPEFVSDNFRHMGDIFPAQSIRKSDTPLEFRESPRTLNISYSFKGKQNQMPEFLKRSNTTSLLIIKNKSVVYERYFKGYKRNDSITSFSVAKSFIGTLVGIALEEGKIQSLSDPITKYVPELKQSGFNGVPIADVLQMSSGIDFSEVYQDSGSDAYTIFDDLFLLMRPIGTVTAKYKRANPSGEKFHYASINTQALGMLLTRVTGKSISSLLEEKLWRPMGAVAGAKWLTDMHETEISFWGLNARTRDFAKLGLLYLNQGKLNGRRILSSDWVKRSTTPDKPFLQPGQIYKDWGYQYHWWIPRGGQGDYTALGIWGQMIYVNPAARMVIVKTSADKNFPDHEFEAITLFRKIARELSPGPLVSKN